jgi:glycosyltransferase involved in cell wall biosynthesis
MHIQREYDEDEGVRVWRLPAKQRRLGWISDRYCLYRKLADWSHQGEIDVIELADWEGWAMGWPRLPVPVVVRLNGSATYFAAEMSQRAKWFTRWLEGGSLRRADFWCSVSRYTADRTRLVLDPGSGPNAVIYNSVELRRQYSIDQRAKHDVVFTGTLTAKKGVISLIKAWPDVVRAHPDAHLNIYGKDGVAEGGQSMQEYLCSQLDESIRPSVTFHGHQSRDVIQRALEAARVAVFPSYAEAFSLAPLEAMSCGCPTIYSQRGSGTELIEHEQDGLLIDPDEPTQISEAIAHVLGDDDVAARLGSRGWERVRDRFTTKQIVSENEQFYLQCVEEFRSCKKSLPKAAGLLKHQRHDDQSPRPLGKDRRKKQSVRAFVQSPKENRSGPS